MRRSFVRLDQRGGAADGAGVQAGAATAVCDEAACQLLPAAIEDAGGTVTLQIEEERTVNIPN